MSAGPGRSPNANLRPEIASAQVLIRFLLRMLILSVFAALGSVDFARTLQAMLVFAAPYCVCVAAIRRETPFGPALSHFHEAAAYGIIAGFLALIR